MVTLAEEVVFKDESTRGRGMFPDYAALIDKRVKAALTREYVLHPRLIDIRPQACAVVRETPF